MKRGFVFLIVLFVSFHASAQWTQSDQEDNESETKPTFKQRLYAGGWLSPSFDAFTDFISVTPLIGYRITKRLTGGVQFQYRYTYYKSVTPRVSTNDYGASTFLWYYLHAPIFLGAELEYLNHQFVTGANEKYRKSFNSFLGGAGFFQPVGGRVALYSMALYNFSYVRSYNYSPYNSPWVFRVGITAGF
jgi:hypothetical protein